VENLTFKVILYHLVSHGQQSQRQLRYSACSIPCWSSFGCCELAMTFTVAGQRRSAKSDRRSRSNCRY